MSGKISINQIYEICKTHGCRDGCPLASNTNDRWRSKCLVSRSPVHWDLERIEKGIVHCNKKSYIDRDNIEICVYRIDDNKTTIHNMTKADALIINTIEKKVVLEKVNEYLEKINDCSVISVHFYNLFNPERTKQ